MYGESKDKILKREKIEIDKPEKQVVEEPLDKITDFTVGRGGVIGR